MFKKCFGFKNDFSKCITGLCTFSNIVLIDWKIFKVSALFQIWCWSGGIFSRFLPFSNMVPIDVLDLCIFQIWHRSFWKYSRSLHFFKYGADWLENIQGLGTFQIWRWSVRIFSRFLLFSNMVLINIFDLCIFSNSAPIGLKILRSLHFFKYGADWMENIQGLCTFSNLTLIGQNIFKISAFSNMAPINILDLCIFSNLVRICLKIFKISALFQIWCWLIGKYSRTALFQIWCWSGGIFSRFLLFQIWRRLIF